MLSIKGSPKKLSLLFLLSICLFPICDSIFCASMEYNDDFENCKNPPKESREIYWIDEFLEEKVMISKSQKAFPPKEKEAIPLKSLYLSKLNNDLEGNKTVKTDKAGAWKAFKLMLSIIFYVVDAVVSVVVVLTEIFFWI